MKKNILITGVAGFIGSKVAERFKKENYNIFGVDDMSTGSLKNIPKGIKFIKADLSNKKVINLLPEKCYQIHHLAGQSSGQISFEDPLNDLSKNTSSTLNLIEYGIKKKVKLFLYASSMSVYGNLLKKKASEHDICQPLSCYGLGKLTSEKYLKIFCKKLPFIGMRFFNVYGPGQNMNNLKQGMVSIYLASILKKNKIIVKGSVNRYRDLIYIDDVVDIWIEGLKNKRMKNKIINLGTGQKTKVSQMLEILKKLHIKKSKIIIKKNTPDDQQGIYADKSIFRLVHKKKFIGIKEGFQRFYNWAKKN